MRISDWSSDVCSSDLSVDDKPEAIEEAGPWNGTIVLGATARTGNTDNTGTTAEVTIAYLGGSWTHRGRASVDYLRNRAQTQEQAFEGEYEAQYDLDHRDRKSTRLNSSH